MKQIKSNINPDSKNFKSNALALEKEIENLNTLIHKIKKPPSAHQRSVHNQNKLPVRERINKLIDSNVPFLELSALAGHELYEHDLPAGGLVTGIGQVQGKTCVIIANDPFVKGGSYFPITVKKHLRAQKIAEDNRLPCIYLVDSGGAFLPLQAEVFPDKHDFGAIFYNEARLSAKNIPQIAVVMGSCTAGGAYVPAMADQVIMVKNQATIFLAGPPLVKAAIGETVTAEALGGAEMHCRVSGVGDYLAETEEDALQMARDIIKNTQTSNDHAFCLPNNKEPVYDPNEILGIIPQDRRLPYDVREIIARLVDDSEFEEFKAEYAKTIVCGIAQLYGMPIGIIANNGILFSESALKATHFIEICSQRQIPLLFLQNITGFMVGKKQEQAGIAKEGAKMVHAVSCTNVPKLTVIIGNSYGAGNYAMCGRAYDPRFLYLWPNAKIGVMGGAQAAMVLSQIKKTQYERKQKPWDEAVEEKNQQTIKRIYESQSSSYYSSARLWDDGIIDPRHTRQFLGLSLSATRYAAIPATRFGVFRM